MRAGSQAGNVVRTEAVASVLAITLDRPPANAVDVATSHALYEAFARLEEDDSLRVGILTGAGERFFCAGWDLKAPAAREALDADHGPGGFARLRWGELRRYAAMLAWQDAVEGPAAFTERRPPAWKGR